jgi:hypothetical protein
VTTDGSIRITVALHQFVKKIAGLETRDSLAIELVSFEG